MDWTGEASIVFQEFRSSGVQTLLFRDSDITVQGFRHNLCGVGELGLFCLIGPDGGHS
jgi:hypothetical protein